MEFKETEEFWKLAVSFFDISDKIRRGESLKIPEEVVTRLKEMLPTTFTKENPYQVYIDGEVHCNIWHEDNDLACGDYYFEPDITDDMERSPL
ncbi:hypothetical protein [Pedobacter panaciterrae]